jgi:hypothetical protein
MVRLFVALLAVAACGSAWAQKKPCEALKSEIEAKLKAKGVKGYTLDIVSDAREGKVVGSCDGGAKKIVYKRG